MHRRLRMWRFVHEREGGKAWTGNAKKEWLHPMSEKTNQTVQAVQESVVNLLELAEQAARGLGVQETTALGEEVHKTVLMLIAAIVVSDGKYTAGEKAFINVLVDWSQKPGGEARYLNEYAEQWRSACMQVPDFFQTAVHHDLRHQTQLARAMMRELQLVGNNTCVSDGEFEATEHAFVRNYICFLEEYVAALHAQNLPGEKEKDATEGWSSV